MRLHRAQGEHRRTVERSGKARAREVTRGDTVMSKPAPTRAPRAGLAAAIALCAGLGAASLDAHAGAIIYNSDDPFFQTVALGVNDEGHLNVAFDNAGNFISIANNASATGLALNFGDAVNRDFRDATAPGCLCEGWGVAATLNDTRVAGFANVAAGSGGLTGGTFGATTTAATSVVSLSEAPLRVQHAYGISLDRNTFQGNITLTNTGTETLFDVVYRRAMDWDVPPTEFNELVTHSGIVNNLEENGGNVRFASNNGFANSDPRVEAGGSPETINTDFVDNGPSDHGSVFDFAFGNLTAGESRTFNIFYGAYTSEAQALAAIATLQPTIYSLGQPNSGGGGEGGGGEGGGGEGGGELIVSSVSAAAAADFGTDGSPTFLFAFGGVGGVEPGLNAANPILPFVSAPGMFFFDAPVPRRWYDPPYATYEYELEGSDPLLGFTFVEVDDIEGSLDVLIDDMVVATLGDMGRYDFVTGSLIKTFKLRSSVLFPVDSESPEAATALPVLLDWTGTATRLTISTIPVPTTGVPAPAPLVLLVVALVGLGLRRRMR
jgi:hypothetical protein